MTLEGKKRALVEYGRDQTHVLHDRHRCAVADRHPGGFLPPMLKREEPVVDELSDRASWGVNAEDATGFSHRAILP